MFLLLSNPINTTHMSMSISSVQTVEVFTAGFANQIFLPFIDQYPISRENITCTRMWRASNGIRKITGEISKLAPNAKAHKSVIERFDSYSPQS